jgi:hypothetical protein
LAPTRGTSTINEKRRCQFPLAQRPLDANLHIAKSTCQFFE